VSGDAELAEGVQIGPYAVVHAGVRLAAGVRVDAHAVLGGDPQDLSFRSGPTRLEVGRGTAIREAAIVHRATSPSRPTHIGAGCLIMGQTHVGHDCQIEDCVVVAQGAVLGGHVSVGTGAVIGGLCGVHQHVRIGERAMVAAMAKVSRDVLPFCAVDGNPATHRALNIVGLRRAGIPATEYRALRQALNRLRSGERLEETEGTVGQLAAFAAVRSPRGISAFAREVP
jgi:UDP-N-acetylglucosamine acyltransferase